MDLVHRIRVFVFRFGSPEPEYLLLRGPHDLESFWTPIHGPMGFGEGLEAAIRREVHEDVGLRRPVEVIDLQMPARWRIGDEEVVEWNYGFHTRRDFDPELRDERWAEFRWSTFTEAYPSLELETDRAAIMRLHTMLFSEE